MSMTSSPVRHTAPAAQGKLLSIGSNNMLKRMAANNFTWTPVSHATGPTSFTLEKASILPVIISRLCSLMLIREETKGDLAHIEAIHLAAFPGAGESQLVTALRKNVKNLLSRRGSRWPAGRPYSFLASHPGLYYLITANGISSNGSPSRIAKQGYR